MNCLSEEQLSLVLHGRVPAVEDAAWTGHIDNCPQCQMRLEQLAGGTDWLPELDEEEKTRLAELGLDHHGASTRSDSQDTHDGNLAASHASEDSDDSLLGILAPSDRTEFKGRFGPFYVIDVVGQGGMGIVLKAHEPALDRTVAVKVLAPQLAASETARRRFLREARAAARVVDDYVVAIHAVDQVHGLPYLVMQLIDGESLNARLRRSGPLEMSEVVQVAQQAARALRAAHQVGLVHRDIKPANILLEAATGRCKITDFGLARAADDETLTRTGVIAGTPRYMAPEQARGESVDHRADLYGLGAVLFSACTAQPPFHGGTALSVINKVIHDEAPAIRSLNPAVPDWLEAIVRRLMAKEPDDRFQSADEVLHALFAHQAEVTTSDAESDTGHAAASPTATSGRRWADNPGLVATIGISVLACVFLAIVFWRNPYQEGGTRSSTESASSDPYEGTQKLAKQEESGESTGSEAHRTAESQVSRNLKTRPEDAIASEQSKSEPSPSPQTCCIRQPDKTSAFADSFGEALDVARDGSIIEVRGPGPIRVDGSLDTQGKKLVIRADDGPSPVILFAQKDQSSALPSLTVSGPLVLEGIEFRYEGGDQQAMVRGNLINVQGQPIHITNCRFDVRGAPDARLSCLSLGRSTGVIQNSLWASDSKGSAIVVDSAADMRVRLENCIILAAHALSLCCPLTNPHHDSEAIRLFSNTVAARCGVHLLNSAGVPQRPGPAVKLQVRDNLFDVGYLCAVTLAVASDPAEAELIALEQLNHTLHWTGGGNLYSVGRAYCGFSSGSQPYVPARSGPRSLVSWQDFSYEEDESSFEAKVIFDNPLVDRQRGPDVRIAPTDYRFSSESPDSQPTRSRRVGADTEIVGPGSGYQAWQRSAAANDWPSLWQDAFE